MRRIIIVAAITLSACGYESRDNDLTGQVKKVIHNTPLICPNYDDVDISLGVIRGGVGSMSTQDVWLTVYSDAAFKSLDAAQKSGAIVNVKYDVKRVAICTDDHVLASVEAAP